MFFMFDTNMLRMFLMMTFKVCKVHDWGRDAAEDSGYDDQYFVWQWI